MDVRYLPIAVVLSVSSACASPPAEVSSDKSSPILECDTRLGHYELVAEHVRASLFVKGVNPLEFDLRGASTTESQAVFELIDAQAEPAGTGGAYRGYECPISIVFGEAGEATLTQDGGCPDAGGVLNISGTYARASAPYWVYEVAPSTAVHTWVTRGVERAMGLALGQQPYVLHTESVRLSLDGHAAVRARIEGCAEGTTEACAPVELDWTRTDYAARFERGDWEGPYLLAVLRQSGTDFLMEAHSVGSLTTDELQPWIDENRAQHFLFVDCPE